MGVEMTDDLIDKLYRNFDLVRLYDSGYKVEIVRSKLNKKKILKFCKDYELKSIEKKLQGYF
jgi:hypothetical protein